MVQFSQPLEQQSPIEQMSIEEATKLRNDLMNKGENDISERIASVEAFQKQRQEKQYGDVKGFQRYIYVVAEFFGYQRNQVKKAVQNLEIAANDLGVMSKNTLEVLTQYQTEIRTDKHSIIKNKTLLTTNVHLQSEYAKQFTEKQQQLERIEKGNVFGLTCSTEALQCQNDMADLEGKMMDLSNHSDSIATELLVDSDLVVRKEAIRNNVQVLYGDIQKQHASVKAQLGLARAQDSMIKNIRGVSSAVDVYVNGTKAVEELAQLQQRFNHTLLEQMPRELGVHGPSVKYVGEPGKPLWHDVYNRMCKPQK